jgi:NhaP-type Na+/H+ and K+/H+ antiporter
MKFAYIFALVGIVLFSSNTFAKNKVIPEAKQIDWIDELNLKDVQAAKVKAIREKSNTQIKSRLIQIDAIRKEMNDIHNQENAEIRTLLDEQQRIKFDKHLDRLNKNNNVYDTYTNGKKPSRKRMRQY